MRHRQRMRTIISFVLCAIMIVSQIPGKAFGAALLDAEGSSENLTMSSSNKSGTDLGGYDAIPDAGTDSEEGSGKTDRTIDGETGNGNQDVGDGYLQNIYLGGYTISGGVWTDSRNYFAIRPEMDPDAEYDEQFDFLKLTKGALMAYPYTEGDAQIFYFDDVQKKARRITLAFYDELDPECIVIYQGGIRVEASFTKEDLGGGFLYQGNAMFDIGADEDDAKPVTISYDGEVFAELTSFIPIIKPETLTDPMIAEMYITKTNDDGSINMEVSGINLPVGEEALFGQRLYWIGVENYDQDTEDYYFNALYQVSEYIEEESVPEQGIFVYKMNNTGINDTQGCWYPIYMGPNPVPFGNGEEATFPTLNPLKGTLVLPDGPTLKRPTVDVPYQVTSESVSVALTSGDYKNFRYSLNDGEYSAWISIPENYTIKLKKNAFGYYDVRFEFNDGDGGNTTSLSRGFSYYNGETAPAPKDAGIREVSNKNVPFEDDTYKVYAGTSYKLYAVYEEGKELEAVLNGYYGSEEIVTLTWDKERKEYSATLSEDALTYISFIEFRVAQGAYDLYPGEKLVRNVEALYTPNVSYASAPWMEKRYSFRDGIGGYFINPGTTINLSFTGSEGNGVKGYADLEYIPVGADENALPETLTVPMTVKDGNYTAAVKIPEDAAKLISIEYYLVDELDSRGESKIFPLDAYTISSTLILSGFDASYEDVSVRLYRKNGEAYNSIRWGTVENGKVSFLNLDPGDYKYVLNGKSGYLSEKTISLSSGITTKEMEDLPKLYTLTVKNECSDETKNLISAYLEKSGESSSWVNFNFGECSFEQIPEGTEYTLTVSAWSDRIKVPEKETFTINGDTEKAVKAEYYDTREISGTITGNDHGVRYSSVRATQTYKRNGEDVTVYEYGYTDYYGNYVLSNIITDFDVDITVEASHFKKKTIKVDAGSDDVVQNLELELRDDLIVRPVLKVKPIVMVDSEGNPLKDEDGNDIVTAGSDVVTDGDSSMLAPVYIRKITSEDYSPYISFEREVLGSGKARYYLESYEALNEGDKLRVFFNQLPESTGYHIESDSDEDYYVTAEGTLNSQRNLELQVKANRLGEFSAHVVDEDSSQIGYMLVLRDLGYSQELVAQASGKGDITVPGLVEGNYSIVTVKVDENRASAFASLVANSSNDIYKAASEGSKEAKLVKAAAAWGQNRYLDNMEPEEAAGSDILGDYEFYYTISIQPDGTANVNVRLSVADSSQKPVLSYIYLEEGTGTDIAAKFNQYDMTAYSDGKRFYYFPYYQGQSSTISFNDGPDSSSMLKAKLTITYYNEDYEYRSQTFEIKENLDIFSLIVPDEHIIDTSDDNGNWTMPLVIRNTPDGTLQTVTVYDNGKVAGKYSVSSLDTKVTITLADRYDGNHVIYAVKGSDENARTTVNYSVYLKDGLKTIYLSHLYWLHRNDTRINQWFFEQVSDIAGKTFRYYPSKGSTIAFRLNNVSPDEIENVKFITYYKETATYWNARLLTSVDNKYMTELISDMESQLNSYEGRKWSTWIVDREANPDAYGNEFGPSLSYFDDFEVTYDLKSESYMDSSVKATLTLDNLEALLADESEEGSEALLDALFDPNVTAYSNAIDKAETDIYNLAYGAETMDYNDSETLEALKNDMVSVNTDALPSALRSKLSMLQDEENITQTDAVYKVEISDSEATEGMTDFSMEYEVVQSSESSLRQRMYEEQTKKAEGDPAYQNISWITFESEQGPVFVRQEVIEQKIDADDSTSEAFETKIQTEYFLASSALTNALDEADLGILKQLQGEEDQTAGSSSSITDQSMTGLKGLGEIHGYYDVYQDIQIAKYGEESRYLGKGVGTGMNVVNTLTTAYEISKGPSGRSPEGLWNALSKLKGSTEHSRRAIQTLTSSIKDYSDLRDEMYLWDSAQAAAQAGGGWANLNVPAKIAFIVGGKIYDTVNKTWSYPALNSCYDTIMKDIMYEIRKEAEFEKKEEEKRLKELEEKLRKRLKREGIKDWDLERKLKEVMKEILDNKLKLRIKEKIPKFKLYIDPSGYVFEAVEEERVSGITASLYQGNGTKIDDTTSFVLWSDPGTDDDIPQQNPITTADAGDTVTDAEGNKISGEDAKGRYGWMTPYGVWVVRFSDPTGKYMDAETNPMEVPPAHTEVNIGLMSTVVPSVKAQEKSDNIIYSEDGCLALDDNKLSFGFDSWMQLESLIDVTQDGAENPDGSFRSEYAAFEVTDQDGNVVPGKIFFPDKTANTGYKASIQVDKYNEDGEKTGTQTVYNKYQTDFIGSDWFIKSVVFQADEKLAAGKEYKLTVSKSVMSYSGVAMENDYSAVVKTKSIEIVFGDVNEDKFIDAKDVTALRRFLAGGWNVVVNEANSDINNDGEINAKDVTQLRRYLAGGWGVVLGKG